MRIALAAAALLVLVGCGSAEKPASTSPAERELWVVVDPAPTDAVEVTTILHCRLQRNGKVVTVETAPEAPEEPDPLDRCQAMVRDGWELLPLDELWELDGDVGIPGGGGCFVATARFEVEVEGLEQPQRVCDSVADAYLPAPVAYRTLPVPDDPELLADVVCEASRDDRAVRLLRTPGVPERIDTAPVCDALQRDGWTVVRWG
jgi:hypothetical protein